MNEYAESQNHEMVTRTTGISDVGKVNIITELTPEMLRIADEVYEEYCDKLFHLRKTNDEEAVKGIKWLYELAGLPEPEVVGYDSPYAVQVGANKKLGRKKMKSEDFAWEGDIFSYSWVAFYDFFTRIGVIPMEGNLKRYKDLVEAGIFMSVMLDGWCGYCRMPNCLSLENERLHSGLGPAVKWDDGFGLYYLYGVPFGKDMHRGIVTGEMSAKEIMQIGNVDQRAAAIRFTRPERIIEELECEMINMTEVRGTHSADGMYFIYEVPEALYGRKEYLLKYSCPSTKIVYIKYADPAVVRDNITHKELALFVLAKSHHMTVEQYKSARHS